MRKMLTLWSTVILLTASVFAQTTVTIDLVDSYGDGWNGGNLNVAGSDYTITSGSSAQFTVDLDDGTYTWAYTPGSWASENSWVVSTADGELFSGAGPDAQGGTFTVGASATITDIYDIQYVADPDTDDTSPLDGQDVTIQGIVTGLKYNGINVQDAAAPWSGIWVYSGTGSTTGLSLGDLVQVTGEVAEYNTLTELISSADDVELLGSGYELEWLFMDSTAQANNEMYEGMLVEIWGTCVDADVSDYGQWEIDDGSGAVQVEDHYIDWDPTLGWEYGMLATVGQSSYDPDGMYEVAPIDSMYLIETPPCEANEVDIICDYGSWMGEVSWDLIDEAGDTVETGGAPTWIESCLEDGSYTLMMHDAYGDGWNGNLWQVWIGDSLVVSLTLESGLEGEATFVLGASDDIFGCTNPEAINYLEAATIDDGSCYFEGDSCSVAIAAVEGDAGNQATGEDQWFSYTATLDGTILATTCYAGQMEDTDLDVYDACDGNIIATSDDAGCGDVTGGNNYASEVEFTCVTGETYYFFWDDTWGPGPNVWYFYEALPPTGPTNLTAEAGLEMVSLEWEGVEPGSRTSSAQVATADVNSNIEADYQASLEKKSTINENRRFLRSVTRDKVQSYAALTVSSRNSRDASVIVTLYDSYGDGYGGTGYITDTSGTTVYAEFPGGWTGFESAYGPYDLADGLYMVWFEEASWAYETSWEVTDASDSTIVYASGSVEAPGYFGIGDDTPQADLSFTDMWFDHGEDALMVTVANTGDMPAGGFYVVYYMLNATDAECGNATYEAYSWITGLDAGGTVDAGVGPGILDYMGGYGTYEFGALVDYLCAIDESDEDNNTITATIEITDPFDGVTWNVYRSDAGADFASLVTVTSMDYLDEAVTGDVEYCYYVTQVDMEGADESSASNTACATPIAPVVLPAPTDLVADADEYNVMVNWVAPDLTDYDPIGGNPPVIGEKIDDVSTYIAYDPADYPLPNRQGGDTVDDATSVDGLPYYNTGTTIGYTDDYDEECPYTGSTSPDVVYSFTPDADVIIDVSLCGEGTFYDTKVYVYENEAGALAGTLAGEPACNDDECANSTTNWLSYLPGVICTAGNTYYIVIDGYGGDAGDYELEILDGTPSPVMGYNVYRDNAQVGYNEGYSNTGWGEFMPTEGTYEYYVTAMYEVFGESDPSNTDTANVSAPAPTCNAPQNLAAETLGNDVSLMWDAPDGGPGWIGYYNGEFNGGVGTGAAAIFECAAMFGPEQLSAYNGMLLTKVAFIPAEVAAAYTVMIYDVSSGTPVAVDSSESFDGADLVIGEFHEVELANAITVDWTVNLMFGFKCNTTTGYPGGIDTGPGVAGYGDIMFYGGAWVSMVNDFGLDYNWAIEGFVDYGDGGRSLTSMEPLNISYPTSNDAEVLAHTLATPVVVNTPSERTMTNYIVYRDDEEIATTEASDAMYYDEDVAFGTHTYFVTAMYDDSEDCGESDPSNQVEVDLMNNPPLGFSLISPGDGYEVFINEDNLDEQVAFIWTQASDPDNDPVEYTLVVAHEDHYHDTTTAQTGMFIDYGLLSEELLEDSVTVMVHYWDVAAHDPYDTTWSNDGPRMFTVDISGLLGVDDDMLPDVFALHNNYPNPFNPVTNITYDIPEVAQVVLEIYNITGQKVRTLAQGQHEPGRYRIQWNATNDFGQALSSGMYIYRIQAGHFVSVKKLILMK